jgi:hypothetical protein
MFQQQQEQDLGSVFADLSTMFVAAFVVARMSQHFRNEVATFKTTDIRAAKGRTLVNC